MAEGTLALPQVEAARPVHRLAKLIPGVLRAGGDRLPGQVHRAVDRDLCQG